MGGKKENYPGLLSPHACIFFLIKGRLDRVMTKSCVTWIHFFCWELLVWCGCFIKLLGQVTKPHSGRRLWKQQLSSHGVLHWNNKAEISSLTSCWWAHDLEPIRVGCKLWQKQRRGNEHKCNTGAVTVAVLREVIISWCHFHIIKETYDWNILCSSFMVTFQHLRNKLKWIFNLIVIIGFSTPDFFPLIHCEFNFKLNSRLRCSSTLAPEHRMYRN